MNPKFKRNVVQSPVVDSATRVMPGRGVSSRPGHVGRRPVIASADRQVGAFHRSPPTPRVAGPRVSQPAGRSAYPPTEAGNRVTIDELRPLHHQIAQAASNAPAMDGATHDCATAGPVLAWLLAVGGGVGLLAALGGAAEEMGLIRSHTDRFACSGGLAPSCPPGTVDVFGSLNPLAGIIGFAIVSLIGALLTMGLALPRRVWLGLQAALTVGMVGAHWLVVRNLVALEVLCPYCTLGCALLIPMFWYTTVHTLELGWLPAPQPVRKNAQGLVRNRRLVLLAWYLILVGVLYAGGDWYQRNPPADGALLAVALITTATLAGAGMARRFADRMGLWLSLASAMMMVSAVTDILPEVWHESGELGIPLWLPAVALAIGFIVITYFTRKGCSHGHDDESRAPATGRHRRLKQSPGTATFGGVGAAAALTAHRVIEGSTLALSPSTAVIVALFVHSASEGLALAALLHEARQRLAPWLVVSASGPAIGVIAATVSPLPEALVPVLLAVVGGVLLRTAVVGLRMAITKWRSGELHLGQIIASACLATALGVFLVAEH